MDSLILNSFSPEIFLSLCILFQLVFNSILVTNIKNNYPIINREILPQLMFILVCVMFLIYEIKIEGFFTSFLFSNDFGIRYAKGLFVFFSLLCFFIAVRGFNIQKLNFFEYFILVLLTLLASLLTISVGDMLSAYLVIELQALSFYVLAAFRRNSAFSTEAGLKYFISGAFISSIFLFGCSLLYGSLGTLNFQQLLLLFTFSFQNNSILHGVIFVGIFCITVTLLFKLAVVPFHFWAPDVYDASPLSSTLIFSIIPKIPLFHFFIKWLSVIGYFFEEINILLITAGTFSVLLGTLFAIRQKRLKRLIIYSSISQGGFLIIALSFVHQESAIAIYFFLIIYIITSLLLWSNFSILYTFQKKIKDFSNNSIGSLFFSNISNLFRVNKIWSFSFIIIFFSIAGSPPLSGFFSKLFIITTIIKFTNLIISLIIILITGISAFYYLKFVKTIFFESANLINLDDSVVTFNYSSFFFDCLLIATLLFSLFFFFFFPSNLLLISSLVTYGSIFF